MPSGLSPREAIWYQYFFLFLLLFELPQAGPNAWWQ
jgi:hypothetical protein